MAGSIIKISINSSDLRTPSATLFYSDNTGTPGRVKYNLDSPSKQNHKLQSRRCLVLSLCLRKAFGKCLRSNMKNYNLQLKALIDINLLFHQLCSFFDLCDHIFWCDLVAQPSSPNSVVNLSCTSRSDLLTVGLCLARTLSKSVLDIGGGTICKYIDQ